MITLAIIVVALMLILVLGFSLILGTIASLPTIIDVVVAVLMLNWLIKLYKKKKDDKGEA